MTDPPHAARPLPGSSRSPSPTPRRRGLPLAEIALVALSLLVCFVLAEIALRAHYSWRGAPVLEDLEAASAPPAGAEVKLGEMVVPSRFPRLVYQLRPNLDVRFLGVPVRTNSAGWRDPEYSWLEDEQTVRILILGDSVAFGWAVEQEERFGDLLGERLAAAHPDVRWRTMTLAAPGYNLQMEVEALQKIGLPAAPHLVIYAYVANDHCLPNFVAPRLEPLSLRSFVLFYASGGASGTGRWVPKDELSAADPNTDESRAWGGLCSPEVVAEPYREMVGPAALEGALEELARVGREHSVPTLLLNLSRSKRLVGDRPLPAGLDYLDVLDARAIRVKELGGGAYMNSSLVVAPDDPHPSSDGHRLIADELQHFLEGEGWIGRLAEAVTTGSG